MKRKKKWRLLSVCLASALVLSIGGAESSFAAEQVMDLDPVAISAEEFESPSMTYWPGVRWWWSGGAVEKEELKEEIEYLAENGFGYVEINPFNVTTGLLEGTEEAYYSVYTEEFYELLDYAITVCEELGITVDLNMGSGWNANNDFVTLEDSMGNMALGRTTVSSNDLQDESISISIPEAEQSTFYYGSAQKGNWDDELVTLQGVLIAERTGSGSTLTSYNEFMTSDEETITYDTVIELNIENSIYLEASDERLVGGQINLQDGDLDLQADGDEEKEFEVIALYFVPSGGTGIDSVYDWYVVDHMDAEKTAEYINYWLGETALAQILANHSNVRAFFNDSYEFYSDVYYNERVYELAQDAESNGIGYDFSKYLPTVYKSYSAAPFYMGLGTSDYFLRYTLDDSEQERIEYDYSILVGTAFAEGMAGFQSALNDLGYSYRQEAYNPPIDTIGAAEYVDIPEAEQGNEMSLIRVSSGAHLYGRNLVTCEQYTLGCTPFQNTLEQVKIGYDIMATSGITNFFYHGFNYLYGEDTELYGENGWSPMASIGINVSEKNTLSAYFEEMNTYAARVNYLMQQGEISKDVAYYMPYNGSLSETDAVKAMNYYGMAWDAINDDSIQDEKTVVIDGVISVNGGNVEYDAIVVESDSVPVETMEKLLSLAEQGATVIFYGSTPETQPGYADGNYEEEDAKVREIAAEMLGLSNVFVASSISEMGTLLETYTNPEVSYSYNENVRFIRRTLDDGSELVYIRNIGTEENTITIEVGDSYSAYYWLDQSTGKIYEAEVVDGTIVAEFLASTDSYSSMNSMAVALLCVPSGVGFAADEVETEGQPIAFADDDNDRESIVLVAESLTITADNLDGVIGGEEETVTFTEQVLGKWNDESFNDGVLQKVVADGIYTTHYTVEGNVPEEAILKLSEVYTAATVAVNGEEVGKLMYEPYSIDIASYLQEGENEITITVTPRKNNRYYNEQNGQYNTSTLVDAGMAGEIILEVGEALSDDGALTGDGGSSGEQANIDKSELEALIEEIENMDLEQYTQASVSALEEALEEAKAVLADDTLTADDQYLVDEQVEKLRAALEALEIDDSTSSDQGSSSTGTGSDQSGSSSGVSTPQTGDEVSNGMIYTLLSVGIISVSAGVIAWRKIKKAK